MKAWLVLVGVLLAGGATLLLLETSTRSATHHATSDSCGLGPPLPGWPDETGPAPDVEYERAFRDGEVVRITYPAGPYRATIESEGARLDRWPTRGGPAPLGEHGCAAAPFRQTFVGMGDGTARVRFWLFE